MKRRFRISFVLLLGILLLGIGLIGLATVPDLMQYAYIPPAKEVSAEESRTAEPVLQKYDDAMASMGEAMLTFAPLKITSPSKPPVEWITGMPKSTFISVDFPAPFSPNSA